MILTTCFLPLAVTLVLFARASEAVSCPGNFSVVGEECFLFLNTESPSAWDAGRSRCSELGGRLAILDKCELFQDVVQFMRFNGWTDASYWIGATDLGDEGAWYWLDGSPVTMGVPFWGSLDGVPEPNGFGSQNCAVLFMTDRHYFHDLDCDTELYSLCQADPLSKEGTAVENYRGEYEVASTSVSVSCPDNYSIVGEGCFLYLNDEPNISWDTARLRCSELGGRLAILDQCDQFADVVKYIRFNGWTDYNYWIGATDRGDEGAWYWLDGSPVSLGVPFWGSRGDPEPSGGVDQNCAFLEKMDRHYFHDGECDANAYALCQADPLS